MIKRCILELLGFVACCGIMHFCCERLTLGLAIGIYLCMCVLTVVLI